MKNKNVAISRNYANTGFALSDEMIILDEQSGTKLSTNISTPLELRLILKLTGDCQHKLNRTLKNEGFKTNEYTFSFKNIYEFLKYLNLPTNETYYYEEIENILKKYLNSLPSFRFDKNWYNSDTKHSTSFRCSIFSSIIIKKIPPEIDEIQITLTKEWLESNEKFFVLIDLKTLKYLKSIILLRFYIYLKTWDKLLYIKGKSLIKDLDDLCNIIGLKTENFRKFTLLKRYVKSLNKSLGLELTIKRKNDNKIEILSKKAQQLCVEFSKFFPKE